VAFYVPLGVRGILFGIGTFLIGVMGGWVYWRASRRRGPLHTPISLTFDFAEPELVPLNG
jgi:hypothetical protein